MNIFVTGSGGYIGGSIALALLAAGHRVRGLTRGPASAERLAKSGIDPVLGTLDDADVLTREACAADGVINTASADHAGAVRALIGGLEGSSKSLLHTSGSSVIGDDARGNRVSEAILDEDTPLVVNPSKQTRRDLDLMVLGAASREVRSAVICPSLIYGVGRGLNPSSVQVPSSPPTRARSGSSRSSAVARTSGRTCTSTTWSNLYLLVLTKAPGRAFYFAENGEASFGDIGLAIAKRLGLGGIEALPPEVAAERWGESMATFTLGSNSRVRAKRARRELGWAPRHSSVLEWIVTEMPV